MKLIQSFSNASAAFRGEHYSSRNRARRWGAVCGLLSLMCGVSASAAPLLFDFGSQAITSGTEAQNAPYTDSSWTASSWNEIAGGYNASTASFHYTDGTAATGVTLTMGVSAANSTTVTFTTAPTYTSSAGTSKGTSGQPFNTAPGRDFVFTGGQSTIYTALGLSIGGLTAGSYDIYLFGANTNQNIGSAGINIQEAWYVSTMSSSPTSLDITTLGTASITSNTSLGSWTLGDNYVKFTVNLLEGEYLVIGETGRNSITGATTDQRAFLSGLQIVPEPSSIALMVLGCVALGFVVRRRAARLC